MGFPHKRKMARDLLALIYDEAKRVGEIKDFSQIMNSDFNKLARDYNSKLDKGIIPKELLSEIQMGIGHNKDYCKLLGVNYYKLKGEDINRINYFTARVVKVWPEDIPYKNIGVFF